MFYRVKQKLLETCYVERDVLVEASSPEEARQKVIDNDTLDTDGDDCCEVDRCSDYGIAMDYNMQEQEPIEDPAWGERLAKAIEEAFFEDKIAREGR